MEAWFNRCLGGRVPVDEVGAVVRIVVKARRTPAAPRDSIGQGAGKLLRGWKALGAGITGASQTI